MPDLFNYFLTGASASERTIASTSQFYNPAKKQFTTDLLRRLGITGSFLGRLTDPGMELGPVLPYVAERCDLKHETLVYTTGSHDTASAVAAVPAPAGEDWCYISSGTWSLMGVELDEPVITDASLEANFTNEAGVQNKIRFLKNIPGLWVLQECKRAWAREGEDYSYAELMERAAAAPHSATVLDLDEFVSPGNHPRAHCRVLPQDRTRAASRCRRACTRLILHSLAVRYKQVLELLEQLTGRRNQGDSHRGRRFAQPTAQSACGRCHRTARRRRPRRGHRSRQRADSGSRHREHWIARRAARHCEAVVRGGRICSRGSTNAAS